MNAPLMPQIDRAILAELADFPKTPDAVKKAVALMGDWSFMDYVYEIELLTGAPVIKSTQTEPGYFFLCTNVSIQHDSPLAPPIVQITDKKKQKSFFDSRFQGASSSGLAGPGAAEPLAEGAAIYWPFGEMANIELAAMRPAGAGNTKLTALVSGWKFPIDRGL